MKKILLFIFIAFLGLLLGLFFSKKPPSTGVVSKVKTPTPSLVPHITGIMQTQPIYYTIQTHSFPTALVGYRATSFPQIEKVASLLTTELNFSSSPNKIEGSKGTYLVWNETGKSLIVGGSPLEVSYSLNSGSTKSLSSDTSSYQKTALTFLNKFSSLFEEIQLKLSSETYILPSGEDPVVVDNPTQATVFLAKYHLLLGGRPLITSAANVEGAAVGVDADNNVLSFHTYVFPQFIPNTAPTSLLSYNEAQNLLVSNRGILLSFSYIGNKNKAVTIAQPDTPPQTSTITNVFLCYYFSPETEGLLPVYVFFGEGVDKQKNFLSTTTVVSATK